MISSYNSPEPYAIKNLMRVITAELHIHGFIVTSLHDKYVDEFYSDFVERVARGEIAYKEYLVRGLENLVRDVEQNQGEMIVSLADRNAFVVGENVGTAPGSVVYRTPLF